MCSHSQQANNARSGTVHSREGWTIIIHVIIRSHVHCINTVYAFIRMETLSISRCGWMRVSVHSFVDLPSPPMAHFSSHQVLIKPSFAMIILLVCTCMCISQGGTFEVGDKAKNSTYVFARNNLTK